MISFGGKLAVNIKKSRTIFPAGKRALKVRKDTGELQIVIRTLRLFQSKNEANGD